MMNLKKYLKTPAMREGEQPLTVYRANEAVADTGTQMIQLALRNNEGASLLQNFPLTRRGLSYLAGFCAACGLAETQLENFDPADLLGRKVRGHVVKNEAGYYVMDAWAAYQNEKADQDAPECGKSPMTLEDLF